MKTIYGILILFGMLVIGSACHDDDEQSLSPEFDYAGPYPAITEGTSEAQKICYDLYKKYDFHVYYTLSGDDALLTDVGYIINGFWFLWDDPLPLQAGDEGISTSFLKLLKAFYDGLPEELVKTSVMKRQVLVTANLWNDELSNYYGISFPDFYSTGGIEESTMQGIVYWGEMDEFMGIQPDIWKYSICLSFFRTRSSTFVNSTLPIPKDFSQVSLGNYFSELTKEEDIAEAIMNVFDWDNYQTNMEYLLERGFVNPLGYMFCTPKAYQTDEMATFATWIACNSLADRQEILETYPLVKKKYDITVKYYKDNFKLDLEAFSKFWVNLEVEVE